MAHLGIRCETSTPGERRAPLAPHHVEELIARYGHRVTVQPSAERVLDDGAYREAGARVAPDLDPRHLSSCDLILGVDGIDSRGLVPRRPQLGVFRLTKGHPSALPLLHRAGEVGATLLDTEQITDRFARRLVHFGRPAGLVGAFETLATLGRRLAGRGIDTPLVALEGRLARQPDLACLTAGLAEVGERLRRGDLPAELHPLVLGVTGGGAVARGVEEALELLPTVEVHAEDLEGLASRPGLSHRSLYRVTFRRHHRIRFFRHLPFLTVLINGIHWEPGDPRLLGREELRHLWATASGRPKLELIADLAADPGGAIAFTPEDLSPERPVRVFDPETFEATDGPDGDGPALLAIPNLANRLPREASERYGDALFPFLAPLLAANWDAPFDRLHLSAPLLGAVITHRGHLTPQFRHLEDPLRTVRG